MTDWTPPDRSRSRAVLIGTSRYTELGPVPAAAHSLEAMHRLLAGPLCGWPADRITSIPEPAVPGDLPDRLIELYLDVSDVALFYYVGHGQTDDEDHLCLGLVQSRRRLERRATTSLTFDAVRRALRASPAATKIVILDCCFAGQAVHGPHVLGPQDLAITDLTGASGAYTLAAAGPYNTATFDGDTDSPVPRTHFTQHLVDIVERGIPGQPTGLTLEPIFLRLREELAAAGRPVPTRSSRDLANTFLFARNTTPRTRATPPADLLSTEDRAHRYLLLDDAERAARTITDAYAQAFTLVQIAIEASGDDPDRTRRLLDAADRLAGGIDQPYWQTAIRTEAAEAALTRDPDRAHRLLDEAERIAHTVKEESGFGSTTRALRLVTDARAHGAFDLDGAERIARGNGNDHLATVIWAAVAADPDRAERIARTLTEPSDQAAHLAGLATAAVAYDLGRARRLVTDAERIARAITAQHARCGALNDVVRAMVRDNPNDANWLVEEAKRIADTIAVGRYQAAAWTAVANATATHDPVAARALLIRAATEVTHTDPASDDRDEWTLVEIVKTMVALDLERAEDIAREISYPGYHALALLDIVQATVTTDPDRAERIARHIPDLEMQATALATVAKAVNAEDPDNSQWLLENARRIAQAGHRDFSPDPRIFSAIARVVATYDPDLAERMVIDSNGPGHALVDIVALAAVNDTAAAERIAYAITDPQGSSRALVALAKLHNQRR